MRTLKFYLEYWGIRLFYLAIIVLIGYGGYCYSVPEFSIGGHLYKNIFYFERVYFTTWFYYLEYFVFIFLFLTGLVFIITLYNALDKRIKERIYNKYMEFYTTYLLNFIFTKEFLSENEKIRRMEAFKKYVQNDYSRILIIDILLQIHHQTIGKLDCATEQLFAELIHISFIRSYLLSPYYKHKTIALNIIAEFKIHGFEKYIIRLANRESNKLLHTDALVTLVRLDTFANLIQLINNNVCISLWEVNVIIDNIEKDSISRIPYKALLYSNNKGMLILGMILSRLHQKEEYKDDIKKYIESDDANVKEEAILTFSTFAEDHTDFVYLRNTYNNTTERGKLSIIETVPKSTDTGYAIEFLEWVAINEPIKFKTEALRNLLTIDMIKVVTLKNSTDPLVKMACDEVLDLNM